MRLILAKIKRHVLRTMRFFLFLIFKSLRLFFYPTRLTWVKRPSGKNWENVNLIFVLNHTSLFEQVYVGIAPVKFLYRMARFFVIPAAQETLKHPFFGSFIKLLSPRVVPITRKRDDSWNHFLMQIKKDSILIAMPEGRMKRPNGLDKDGKKMTVRGGAYEMLDRYRHREAIFLYSDGLHHILPPGAYFPKVFKTLSATLEAVQVGEYLDNLAKEHPNEPLKFVVANDLDRRRDLYCKPHKLKNRKRRSN